MSRKRKVFDVTGFEKLVKNMIALQGATDEMLQKSIYPGAGLMADEVRKAIENLPETDTDVNDVRYQSLRKADSYKRSEMKKGKAPKGAPRGATKTEKKGMLEGLGLAPIRMDKDFINTKAGMDGYNDNRTAAWPKGKPNVMIARAIESGTSFRQKTPFIEPTYRKNKEKALELMAKEFDSLVTKYI